MSYLADQELRQVFESALRKDEKLLWAGRPKTGSIDSRYLFHTLFIAFWLVMVFFIGGTGMLASLGSDSPGVVALPFMLIPLIMMAFGLAFFAFSVAGLTAPSRHLYAVTNKRAIVYGGRFQRAYNSRMKGQISDVCRSGNDEIGTLKFVQGNDLGMMAVFMTMSAPSDKFFNIEKPADVEALIFDNLFD